MAGDTPQPMVGTFCWFIVRARRLKERRHRRDDGEHTLLLYGGANRREVGVWGGLVVGRPEEVDLATPGDLTVAVRLVEPGLGSFSRSNRVGRGHDTRHRDL